MTGHSAVLRAVAAATFALLLALRLLSPAGFMPAFDGGSVSIVICPDADPAPMQMPHHHHHGNTKFQQHCPYAAGSVLATGAELAPVVAALVAEALLISAVAFELFCRRRLRNWPPSIGPPLPA